MTDLQTIQHRIKLALDDGETLAGLARKADLHRNTLYGCQSADWNPSYDTVIRLSPHLPEVECAA